MKIKNTWLYPRNWPIVRVYRDFENYIDWIKVIGREERTHNSKYNKWKLKRTKLFDVYTIVTLDDADLPLPEVVKRTKVIETLNPLHRYLDEELGFAECLNCEFNQFFDDENEPTLSYLILYRFRFEKFSIKWLIRFLLITGILIFLIFKLGLIALIVNSI